MKKFGFNSSEPVFQFFPIAVVARSVLSGKLRCLRFDPPEWLIPSLAKRMARPDAGPHDVSGPQMKSLAFYVHEGFSAEGEIQLLYRMVVITARASDRQFSPHHEEVLRAEFPLHEPINGKTFAVSAVAE